MSPPEKPFGSHPAIIILTIVASLLAVFEFVTNFHSLRDISQELHSEKAPPSASSPPQESKGVVSAPIQPDRQEAHVAGTRSSSTKGAVPSDIVYAAGGQGDGVYEVNLNQNVPVAVAHTSLFNNCYVPNRGV